MTTKHATKQIDRDFRALNDRLATATSKLSARLRLVRAEAMQAIGHLALQRGRRANTLASAAITCAMAFHR